MNLMSKGGSFSEKPPPLITSMNVLIYFVDYYLLVMKALYDCA